METLEGATNNFAGRGLAVSENEFSTKTSCLLWAREETAKAKARVT